MTTDRSSPHQLALDLAGMMYVGLKRGGLGDRRASAAAASVADGSALVVDTSAADRLAERAPAAPRSAEPTAVASVIAAPQPGASAQTETPDQAPDVAVEAPPAASLESRPPRLVADAVDEGAGDDDALWSQDAASPHDVVAAAPRRRRGLTVGEQRRRRTRKRSTLAPMPAAEVDEAPELDQLHDVDVDEAPIAALRPDESSGAAAEVTAPAPGVGALAAEGWQQARPRRRLRRQARTTPVKRRKALRGVVVGLVASALVATVIAVDLSLGGHADPGASSSTSAPPAAIISSATAPSAAATAHTADRRERAKRAAQVKRQQQRKVERERSARNRREARERRQVRERAARRARQRDATLSIPAAVASAPAASRPTPAPAGAAPAPAAPSSSSSSDRAGWTGEFTP